MTSPDQSPTDKTLEHLAAVGVDTQVAVDTREEQRAKLMAELHRNETATKLAHDREQELDKERQKLKELQGDLKNERNSLLARLRELDPTKKPRLLRAKHVDPSAIRRNATNTGGSTTGSF